jgi:hypothetical protein
MMILYHLNRLVFPLIISNTIHMIAIRKGWLEGLNRPISTRLFGANKTWRGFVLLPLLNAAAVVLFSYDSPVPASLLLGAMLGIVYLLFELPNSFLKRRIGIAPGEQSSQYRTLFLLLDKTDSALGVSLAYYLLAEITLLHAAVLFIISSATHIIFSLLLVSLHIKKSF